MSHKSNTRVYKLKNYGNMTLRVESAPVAQCLVYIYVNGCTQGCVREAPPKKKRENVGIFPKWGAPPPSPLFGNDMFFFFLKLWFILHFRTFFWGISHVKNSKKWKWDSGRPPPPVFSKFPHFPVFFWQRP